METAILAEEATETEFDLTVSHRCDRCSAQAFIVGLKEIDGDPLEVLLCGHHGKKHTQALEDQGFDVLDFTHRLNEKPSVSANAL